MFIHDGAKGCVERRQLHSGKQIKRYHTERYKIKEESWIRKEDKKEDKKEDMKEE